MNAAHALTKVKHTLNGAYLARLFQAGALPAQFASTDDDRLGGDSAAAPSSSFPAVYSRLGESLPIGRRLKPPYNARESSAQQAAGRPNGGGPITPDKAEEQRNRGLGAGTGTRAAAHVASTFMAPRPNVLIVSFPKSGRTWIRVFLSRYRQNLLGMPEFDLAMHLKPGARGITYDFTHARSDPKFGFLRLRKYILRNSEGRVLRRLPPWFHGVRAIRVPCDADRHIFLVRDPRDVLVSFYHQARSRNRFWAGDMDSFARHRFIGIERIIELMNHLVARRASLNAPFFYYEDMIADPDEQFLLLVKAAQDCLDEKLVREAVQYSSFERMRRMEQSGRFGKRLSQWRQSDPNSLKTRKGGVGGYMEEMPTRTIAYVEDRINSRLDPFFERYIH